MEVKSTDRIVAKIEGDERHTAQCIRNGYGRDYGCTCESSPDALDPEAPAPDPHASERKRFTTRPFPGPDAPCVCCKLGIREHINETFCPEWRLRQLDGDR